LSQSQPKKKGEQGKHPAANKIDPKRGRGGEELRSLTKKVQRRPPAKRREEKGKNFEVCQCLLAIKKKEWGKKGKGRRGISGRKEQSSSFKSSDQEKKGAAAEGKRAKSSSSLASEKREA